MVVRRRSFIQEKEKKDLCKEVPGIKQMEGASLQILDSRTSLQNLDSKGLREQTAALAFCNGSEVIMLP